MKKITGYFLLICFLGVLAAGCDTNKPGQEAKDAKDRVEKKVEDASEKRNETPDE